MVLCVSMNTGSMVGTFDSYFMQKNLFEVYALTDCQVTKLRVQVLALEPPGGISTT